MDLLGQCSTDIIYVSLIKIKNTRDRTGEGIVYRVRSVLCEAIDVSIILEGVS